MLELERNTTTVPGQLRSGRWRVLGLMTFAQAGASLVQQALGSMSPVLVAAFALSKARLGLIFTAILVGATCFTAISGALTDRAGERKMLLASGSIMTGALLGAALASSYAWLVAMAGIYGVGYAASTPAGGRAILAWFDRDRGFAMGVRQTGVSVGALVGAVAFPVLATLGGYRAAFAFAALVVAISSGAAYVSYRELPGGASPVATLRSMAADMRSLLRDPRLICVSLTCMLLSASQFVMNAFLTITAVTLARTSVHVAGYALAVAFVAAICGRLGWGYVSDRHLGGDRFVLLAANCALVAIGSTALAFLWPGAIVPLFLASTLLSLSASGWNGLMAAALSEVGGVERAATSLGLGLTAIFAASAIGPWAFGAFADQTSIRAAWLAVAGMVIVGVGPMFWLRRSLEQASGGASRSHLQNGQSDA